MDVGQKVRRLRRERDITQAVLAKRAGIATNTVNRIEKGHMPRPSADSLAKIAQALGVSVGALYSEESVTVRKVEDPSGAALGPSDSERTVIEPSAEAGSNLASLLRRLGSPTQHFANQNLIRELEGLSNREFYATIEELDKEIEFLTVELDRRRKEAIPGTPSYLATMRFWDTTGRLYLALKMLIRARDNVEPQEVHVEEILKLSRELSELTGVAG